MTTVEAAPPRPALAPRPLDRVAAVLGLAYLWAVLGGSFAMQWWRIVPTPGRLQALSLFAVVVIVVALLTKRLPRQVPLLAALMAVWLAAGALSSWRLTGVVDSRSLLLALASVGVLFGAAATRPAWVGWSIIVIGSLYLLLNLVVYWKGYYSLGTSFPGTTSWNSVANGYRADSLASKDDWYGYRLFLELPYPDSVTDRAIALLRDVPRLRLVETVFEFRGLSGTPNQTGNFVAPFLAFVIPFLSHRARGRTGRRIAVARVALIAAIVGVGLSLLYFVDARTAAFAVAISAVVLVVPLGWSRNPRVAGIAAVLLPLAMMIPFVLTQTVGLDLTERRCLWQSWLGEIRASPVWGIGPPGHIESICRDFTWFHSHNEFLQAWSMGGLMGLFAAVVLFGWLSWIAVRYSDRDDRALLTVLVCCIALMSMEVLSSGSGYWVYMGIAYLIAVVARSLNLMTPRQAPSDAPGP
ncbi:MAG: hypothetical protein R2720_14640 [Candidatus Nanopelagicales bacterium]